MDLVTQSVEVENPLALFNSLFLPPLCMNNMVLVNQHSSNLEYLG